MGGASTPAIFSETKEKNTCTWLQGQPKLSAITEFHLERGRGCVCALCSTLCTIDRINKTPKRLMRVLEQRWVIGNATTLKQGECTTKRTLSITNVDWTPFVSTLVWSRKLDDGEFLLLVTYTRNRPLRVMTDSHRRSQSHRISFKMQLLPLHRRGNSGKLGRSRPRKYS